MEHKNCNAGTASLGSSIGTSVLCAASGAAGESPGRCETHPVVVGSTAALVVAASHASFDVCFNPWGIHVVSTKLSSMTAWCHLMSWSHLACVVSVPGLPPRPRVLSVPKTV